MMIDLEGRNVVFIPRNADRLFFAAAHIALSQYAETPSAVISYDPRIVPKAITELPPSRVRYFPLTSPLELAICLSPPAESFAPLTQRDNRWARHQLGEGSITIGVAGCLVVSLAMLLQDVYQTTIQPDALADALLLERDCFNGDYLDWIAVVRKLPRLTSPIRKNGNFEIGNVRLLRDQGHLIIVANPKISHFAYLLCLSGDRYRVADPWIGITEWKAIGGVRAAKVIEPEVDSALPKAIFVLHY